MSTNSISLPAVAETGMLTFYCHVIESQTPQPILLDQKAVEISHQLNPLFANSSSRILRSLAEGKVSKELVVHITLRAKKYKDLILTLQSRFPGSELVCEVVTELFIRKPWNRMVALKLNQQLGVGKGAAFTFGVKNSRVLETWHPGIEYLDDWSYFDTRHPRLGWMGPLGKMKLMRNVQYTVHYRLC